MHVAATYASPSALNTDRDRAELSLAADVQRPVSFSGEVVRHVFTLRIALRALGQAIWSRDQWSSDVDFMHGTLDPVITVHPDRIGFEAFTQDMGAYVALHVDPALFRVEGETRHGTTNIDFTAWLWGALGELRTHRRTRLHIGAEGFEVATPTAGGRFERKVDVPDAWLRGFLQTQGAMALPGTRLKLRPADLLAAIRFLKANKAKASPRALRYELQPGAAAALVLEPFEHRIVLEGTGHGATEPRSIRTWGRRKLDLIEPLLPFADDVEVYLKGRALPSFYSVQLPGMSFLLGMTGVGAGSGFGESAGLDLVVDDRGAPAHVQQRVLEALQARFHAGTADLAAAAGATLPETSTALAALARGGRVMFDVRTREWRHRELFATPPDPRLVFPPDARREAAQRLVAQPGGVLQVQVEAEEQRRRCRHRDPGSGGTVEREIAYRQWRVRGRSEGHSPEIVVNAEDRLVFGTCGCAFFQEHLLNRGPCEHMLALLRVSEPQRREVALVAPAPAPRPPRPPRQRAGGDTASPGEEPDG